jgi:hypothetical protein
MNKEQSAAVMQEIEAALAPRPSTSRPLEVTISARTRPHVVEPQPTDEAPAPLPSITDRLDRLDKILALIYGRLDAIEAKITAEIEIAAAELRGRLG